MGYMTASIARKFTTIFQAPSLTSASDKDKQINKVFNNDKWKNGIRQFGEIKDFNSAYLPPIVCIEYNQQRQRQSADVNGNGNGGVNVSRLANIDDDDANDNASDNDSSYQ